MPNFVLGCDPGKASGLAVYNLESCTLEATVESQQGVKGFVPIFTHLVEKYNPHIACEGFNLRASNKFTADLSGVECIGWLKGQGYNVVYPTPVQHMTLTRLREKADKGKVSPVTTLMKSQGYVIGKGHTRMAGSVCFWYAAKVLNHRETLKILSEKKEK